jgi:hypothetical protein
MAVETGADFVGDEVKMAVETGADSAGFEFKEDNGQIVLDGIVFQGTGLSDQLSQGSLELNLDRAEEEGHADERWEGNHVEYVALKGHEDEKWEGNHVDYIAPDDSELELIPRIFTVDLWMNDEQVVLNGIQDLVTLLDVSDEERRRTLKAINRDIGGFAALVAALRKWYDSVHIQEFGLVFLLTTLHNEWSVFRIIAENTDVVQIVLTAMENFPGSEWIQENGCGVLHAVSRTGEYSKSLVTTELDVIDATIKAMQYFPMNQKLQEYGCMIFDWGP